MPHRFIPHHHGGPVAFIRPKPKQQSFFLQIIKTILLFTIAPIRFVGFLFCYIGCSLNITIFNFFLKYLPKYPIDNRPTWHPTRVIKVIGPLWARLTLFFLGFHRIHVYKDHSDYSKILQNLQHPSSQIPTSDPHFIPPPNSEFFNSTEEHEQFDFSFDHHDLSASHYSDTTSLVESLSLQVKQHLETDPHKVNHSIIISNHSTIFDGLVLWSQFWSSCVVKESFQRAPFLGEAMKAMKFVFIPRHPSTDYMPDGSIRHVQSRNPPSNPSETSLNLSSSSTLSRADNSPISSLHTKHTDTIAARATAEYDSTSMACDTLPLACFPEGTTTNNKFLTHFYSGVFCSKLPVIPMILEYPSEYFSPTWETIPVTSYFKSLLSQVYNRLNVHILPVYYPSPAEKSDPVLYASNVRKLIAFYSDMPIVHSTIADKFVFHALLQKNIDWKTSWKLWKQNRAASSKVGSSVLRFGTKILGLATSQNSSSVTSSSGLSHPSSSQSPQK